jgi:hypothetical protein
VALRFPAHPRRTDRQRKAERAARTCRAAHPDRAAIQLDQRLGDRQPQPRAAQFASQGIIGAVEAPEQRLLLLGRDADAVVADIDLDVAFDLAGVNGDGAAGVAELDRVGEQRLNNLGDVDQAASRHHGPTQPSARP